VGLLKSEEVVKMVASCRTPESMIPKLMFICSTLFILSCFVFSFAWYINGSNMTCLAPASHAAFRTFAKKVQAHLESLNVTDISNIPESFDFQAIKEQEVVLLAKRDRFQSASVASDYVLAVAITYAFTIMLTALYAFVSLCCCPNNWYISKCIRYQYPANVLGGVLCVCLIVTTSVHAGLSDGLWAYVGELTGNEKCKDVLWSEQRNWCPCIIFFSIVVLFLHGHVALVTYIFKRETEALAKKRPGSSTNSSSHQTAERGDNSQQQQLPKIELPKNEAGASAGSGATRGFTNMLTTFKANGRPRIPSTRNYPSSPVLPVTSTSLDENSPAAPGGSRYENLTPL